MKKRKKWLTPIFLTVKSVNVTLTLNWLKNLISNNNLQQTITRMLMEHQYIIMFGQNFDWNILLNWYKNRNHVTLQPRCTRSLSLCWICQYFIILSVNFKTFCIGLIMNTSTVKGDRKREIGQSPIKKKFRDATISREDIDEAYC